MPNVTITSNARISDSVFSPRSNGEDAIVSNGATLTIDCDVSTFSGGVPLLGNVTINEGIVTIDGRGIRLLDFSSATGTLALYATVTGGQSGATGVVIQTAAGAQGIIKIRRVAGEFEPGEGITAAGWSAVLSQRSTGHITVLMEQSDRFTVPFLGRLEILGNWLFYGTGNGAIAQSLNHYNSATLPALWVEKAVNFTATPGSAALLAPGQDFRSGQNVRIHTTGSAPGGFSTAASYYVLSASGSEVMLAASAGSPAIVPASAGTGVHTLVAGRHPIGFTAGSSLITAEIGHSFVNGDEMLLETSGTLPGPFDRHSSYWVIDSNPSAGTFRLATSPESTTAIAASGSGQLSGHWGLLVSSWDTWINIRPRLLSDVGVGRLGRFFSHIAGGAIAFGDGVNGNLLLNGARAFAPNVTIGCATTSAPTTATSPTNLTLHYQITATLGRILFRTAIASGFSPSIADVFSLEWRNFAFWGRGTLQRSSSPLQLRNVAIALGVELISNPTYLLQINDILGGELNRLVAAGAPAGSIQDQMSALWLNRCQSVMLKEIVAFFSNKLNGNLNSALFMNSSGIEVEDIFLIGGRSRITNCFAFKCKTIAYCDTPNGALQTLQNHPAIEVSGGQGLEFDGILLVASPPRSSLFTLVGSASDILIRNCGSRINPVSLMSHAAFVLQTTSTAGFFRLRMSNFFVTGIRTAWSSLGVPPIQITMTDSGVGYGEGISPNGNNASLTIIRGCQGNIGNFSFAHQGVTGFSFLDFFTSATTGLVGLAYSPQNPGETVYEALAGTPVLDGNGNLLLRSLGDQVLFTCAWFIRGYSGFANTNPSHVGTNVANHQFEYRIDTGAGFSGAFKALTGANLSTEAITPAPGFRLQIRITCAIAAVNNVVNRVSLISMITTAAHQQGILYPVTATAALRLVGLIAESEIRVFRASDNLELAGVESSGSSFEWVYEWEQDFQVRLVIFNQPYRTIDLTVLLVRGGVTIPIQQLPELVYLP